MNKMFFSVALLSAIVGGAVGGTVGLVASPALREPLLRLTGPRFPEGPVDLVAPPPVLDQMIGIAEDEQSIAVVERVQPAVVSIVISKDLSKMPRQVNPYDPFSQFYEPVPQLEGKQRVGGGSGFLVSSDGMIVTNRHVVEDPQAEYTVVLPNGKKLPATVLARDPVLDLAVIDVEGEGFPFLTFGDPSELKTGQTVIAIGNALDEFRNTVTKGIVSGLNRRIFAEDYGDTEVLEEAIQTDAAINPGNSGGPLIDLHGRVVGVNTAVSLSGQLLGFALPGDLAERDVEQVKKIGRITRPFLGVRYLIINEELIEKNQLKVTHGVLVARGVDQTEIAVIPGSPAEKSGIQENDIILSVDGASIDEEHSLSSLIGRKLPGDEATLRILRHGEESDVKIILEEYKTAAST